jgi:hypothetical protein
MYALNKYLKHVTKFKYLRSKMTYNLYSGRSYEQTGLVKFVLNVVKVR